MKIVIVEDNASIRKELAEFLSRYHYEVEAPEQFDHIVEDILSRKPQLVLLDINLPVYDGFYICRELRRVSQVPVIVVTSRDSEVDELMSMNLGADDFITKPYHTQILLARIASVLKRTYGAEPSSEISHGGITLRISQSVAASDSGEVELSKNEMRILFLLMKHHGAIIPRDDIMNELWQSDEFVDDNTLTVNINRLRRKLESIGAPDYIITKRGQGYMV